MNDGPNISVDPNAHWSRRRWLSQSGLSLGGVAVATLLNRPAASAETNRPDHPRPRARQILFLNMSGGPSQLDLFDPKPELQRLDGTLAPQELQAGEKFAQLTGPMQLLASPYRFARHGASGAWFSELLPHMAALADEWTVIRSLTTDSVNHDPAQLLLNTGADQPGRPAMGAWISYGLGSLSRDLPEFVVLLSGRGQPLGAHCWSSGFLPGRHQGVQFFSQRETVPYLSDPVWMSRVLRRDGLDSLRTLNELEAIRSGDEEISTRIQAYEMAFRMQAAVPTLTDLSRETAATLTDYGVDLDRPSYARNCLLARRMLERGVRFVQVFHRDWDHHGLPETGGIDQALPAQCREVDRPTAALLLDLKRRGLLENTIVVWGGEFGRTPIRQQGPRSRFLGRDHHRRAFTMLLAGGGLQAGLNYGATDELGFHAAEKPLHVHDLQATLLHCLGLDHLRLTYRHDGREMRLTDVGGNVVHELLRS